MGSENEQAPLLTRRQVILIQDIVSNNPIALVPTTEVTLNKVTSSEANPFLDDKHGSAPVTTSTTTTTTTTSPNGDDDDDDNDNDDDDDDDDDDDHDDDDDDYYYYYHLAIFSLHKTKPMSNSID